jgi:hypothetical protein
MPAIIRFPGYNPLPPAHTLGGRLARHRTSLGLSQEEADLETRQLFGSMVRRIAALPLPIG